MAVAAANARRAAPSAPGHAALPPEAARATFLTSLPRLDVAFSRVQDAQGSWRGRSACKTSREVQWAVHRDDAAAMAPWRRVCGWSWCVRLRQRRVSPLPTRYHSPHCLSNPRRLIRRLQEKLLYTRHERRNGPAPCLFGSRWGSPTGSGPCERSAGGLLRVYSKVSSDRNSPPGLACLVSKSAPETGRSPALFL